MTPSDRIAAELLACADDPGRFNASILGRPAYWWRQEQICRAVTRYKTTVVETGNQVGKSYLLAGLTFWWLFTRPNAQVVITAPSQTLLGTVAFKEIRKAARTARVPLGVRITDSPNASPQVVIGRGDGVLGIATKGVERLSGQHAVNLLHLVDEGSGIETEIGEALDSQNPIKSVVFGNPIRAEGWFADLAKRGEKEAKDPAIPDAQRTFTINIPSTDSPDIREPRSKRGLADADWLATMGRKYGRESLWYRTHILAQRPAQSHDVLIPPEWLDPCARAKLDPNRAWGHRRIAADLGEGVGRDRTAVVCRDDRGLLEWSANHAMGLPEAAAEIARMSQRWNVDHGRISYDGLGVGRDLRLHLPRHGIARAKAYKGSFSGGKDFFNLRSAAAYAFRRRVDPTLDGFAPFAIPYDENWPHLREEVLAHRYELVGGKIKLETKEDVMARLGHSPDFADALFQTFAFTD